MANVNPTPFNLIPDKWAFDPEIGPFMRELLDVIFQTRSRTGGSDDLVLGAGNDVEAVNSALQSVKALALQKKPNHDIHVRLAQLQSEVSQLRAELKRIDDIEVKAYGG